MIKKILPLNELNKESRLMLWINQINKLYKIRYIKYINLLINKIKSIRKLQIELLKEKFQEKAHKIKIKNKWFKNKE
jgi:hypothetical protein